MRKIKVINPGDKEAVERLRGERIELSGEKSERIMRVYGPIILVISFLVVLLTLVRFIYKKVNTIEVGYNQTVSDSNPESNDQSMLTRPMMFSVQRWS